MYRKDSSPPQLAEDFTLPFDGQLDAANRWVLMAQLIPWDEFEEEYAQKFPSHLGSAAKSLS